MIVFTTRFESYGVEKEAKVGHYDATWFVQITPWRTNPNRIIEIGTETKRELLSFFENICKRIQEYKEVTK